MQLKEEIVRIARLLYDKGFLSATDGNISALTPENSILITRSAVCKGELTVDDIIEIDLNGSLISGKGKISTENKLHLAGYKNRKDVRAVIHCHPVFATVLAVIGDSIDKPVFPEVLLTLGRVPLCEYATPSTDGLHESIMPYISNCNAFLLANHGALTFGSSLKDAFYKMDKLEHASKILVYAKQTGRINYIPDEKVKELYSIAKSTYGIDIKN